MTCMMEDLTGRELENIIPHRKPMRFLDEILELDPMKKGKGRTYIEGTESFLQGHYPGSPIMPGTAQIEALSQLATALILSSGEYADKNVYFAGIKNARFFIPIRPKSVIELECEISKIMGNVITASGEGKTGDRVCFKADMIFSVAAE